MTRSSLLAKAGCVARLLLIAAWGVAACSIQTVLIHLPGSGKVRLARVFWAVTGRMLGMRVRVIGRPAGAIRDARAVRDGARPIVYVANHCSWLDILAIGGLLHTVFVAKGEVGGWPLIGTISRLGRSIFVSRNRQNTGRELADMAERLWSGDDIVLFPEGTSSDGSRVLPFRSAFFAVAKPGRDVSSTPKPPPVLVQPVSIVYDELEGLPVGRARRPVFSWWGAMDLTPHVWSFCQWRTSRVTVLLHEPLNPDDFQSRKDLANAAYAVIRDGAAALRQGRLAPKA